jgi:hypothetical protein
MGRRGSGTLNRICTNIQIAFTVPDPKFSRSRRPRHIPSCGFGSLLSGIDYPRNSVSNMDNRYSRRGSSLMFSFPLQGSDQSGSFYS